MKVHTSLHVLCTCVTMLFAGVCCFIAMCMYAYALNQIKPHMHIALHVLCMCVTMVMYNCDYHVCGCVCFKV